MTNEIELWLREDRQLGPGPATLTPLGGGVSCEIFTVEQDGRKFVVKRALEKLKVAADWRADVSRNATEYAFYETMAQPLAGCLPRVLHHNPARGYFTMEYLEDGWTNWKEMMMEGIIEPAHGRLAGALLGTQHAVTWKDDRLAQLFDTTENFRQLRVDPYLRTSAERHPEARAWLRNEADRVENCHVCLVHGDFSPKNLLIKETRMVLLDAEVAWFGEPAFDLAFMQTHLFLKGLYHAPREAAWGESSAAMWEAYRGKMGDLATSDLESRACGLLAALILARVDGKSPAEYLNAAQQQIARAFALEIIRQPLSTFAAMRAAWNDRLPQLVTS